MDFSIARLKRQATLEATRATTRCGIQGPGTPAYMAPEVYKGSDVKRQPAVDVYALGLIIIEEANQGSHCRPNLEAITKAMQSELPPPGIVKVPQPLRSTVEKALRWNPKRRPTARDVGIILGEMYNEVAAHGKKPVWY